MECKKYCEDCKFSEREDYRMMTSWDEWVDEGDVKKISCIVSGEAIKSRVKRYIRVEKPQSCIFYEKK
jgi:hypothetical protein